MLFTPKGLHNTVQGCRAAATLGDEPQTTYPEGVASNSTYRLCNPFRVGNPFACRTQGSREYAATLGYGMQPLRGKDLEFNLNPIQ